MSSFIKGLGLDLFDFNRKFISVIEEHYADASFCLSCFMWQALTTQDTGVLLLTIRHSLRHYYHVGMRLGYNLSTAFGTRFLAVDAVDIREAHLKQGREVELKPKIVFEILKNKIALLKNHCKSVFIIIDDLSDFMNLGVSSKETLLFIQYVRMYFQQYANFIVSSQCHEEDEEQVKIKNFLLHFSDLRISIKCLETGFSKDVTGCIEIVKTDEDALEGWSKPLLYHYKSKDRNINVFLPGNISFSY